ncbi:MAG TPA: c-type cytochrome [Gemmatimonadales bacterium]|nr:c-type cytochrome [Gemmatimonadales bacterium]
MPTIRCITAMIAGVVVAAAACKAGPEATQQAAAPGTPSADRIPAGGVAPPANALAAARPAKLNPDAGGSLFGSMNCDGCHGGGAIGWVGPSLVDGRWRYGGSDEDIFTSIFYGRPKGMPAYGGVVGTDGVWLLVAYIKSQAVPAVVPTTSWLPGGNASPTPAVAPAAAAPAPAAENKASVAPEELPAKYGCFACHSIDKKVVGPAYKDVAAKYRGQDVELKLVDKVRLGGSGVWGSVPMIPNPQVPDADLHAVVKWILSLK